MEKLIYHLIKRNITQVMFLSRSSAMKPPTQNTSSTKSNMSGGLKKQVSPSLGISADASFFGHAATFSCSQINNLSIQSSIHASDSTSSGYQCHWDAQGLNKYTAAPTNRPVPRGRPVNQRGKVQATTPWPHSLVLHGSHRRKTSQVLCFYLNQTSDQRRVLSF